MEVAMKRWELPAQDDDPERVVVMTVEKAFL